MKKIFLTFILQLLLFNHTANAIISNWQDESNGAGQVRALASYYQSDITQKVDYKKPVIGIEFKLKKGWKIYGKDSGDIGIEPQLDFSNNKNYNKHQIFWPESVMVEEDFGNIIYKYSIYKNHVIIPLNLHLKEIKDSQNINFTINYGLCKEICIPASKTFNINLDKNIDITALEEIDQFHPKHLITIKKTTPTNDDSQPHSILFMLIIAVIGGAILNIMPCVLPVLSIKLLSIIKNSTAKINKIRYAFFATIMGILSCFVIFAIIAIIIKITGNSLGWGLQFQNPYFLVFLIVILVFFTANLLGIYEINLGQNISNLINKKITKNEQKKKVFITNYLSGILAVLLATPCSAPFLGSAISFALVQSHSIIILMFFAIGLGFALPYIILFFAPKLVYLLPKPGKWMEGFKQLMSGFLMATIIWLVYVLIGLIGNLPAYVISFIAVTMVACLRIKNNLIKHSLIAILTITLFTLPFALKQDKDIRVAQYNSIWQNFVEEDIGKYVSQGKIVVIDITADWCITCKINKIRVLENTKILKALQQEDIIAMQSDITRPKPEVMEFLAKHKRYAIPFNAVYGPNAKNGILTSELLTTEELLKTIQQARGDK